MDPEEKIRIVFEGLRSKNTVLDVCKKYGISSRTFYDWKKQIENGAIEYIGSKTPGRKKKEFFESKDEAEKILKQKDKEILALKKELEGVRLQRDFYEFSKKLRSGKKKQ